MKLKKATKEAILRIVTELGNQGVTFSDIGRRLGYERHTVSKYMGLMKKEGFVDCKQVGKAKLWYLRKNSIENVIGCDNSNLSFVEKTLCEILDKSPVGMFIIDRHFRIIFMNQMMSLRYGDLRGEMFYKSVQGKENPLSMRSLLELIDDKKADFTTLSISDRFGEEMLIRASKLKSSESVSMILIVDSMKRLQQELPESAINAA